MAQTPWVGCMTSSVMGTHSHVHPYLQEKSVQLQQALTMDVWHGRVDGVPPQQRLRSDITLELYTWTVGVVCCGGVDACTQQHTSALHTHNRLQRGRWVYGMQHICCH